MIPSNNSSPSQDPHLWVIDRKDGSFRVEKVALGFFMRWLFCQPSPLKKAIRTFTAKALWLSHFVGWLCHQSYSKKWIEPFVENHSLDLSDFEKPEKGWLHFDDFFSRKLRKEARVIPQDKALAIMPADARYRRLETDLYSPISIKNQNWNLNELLGPLVYPVGKEEASSFSSPLLARLCPTDYHRFHSPIEATVGRIVSMGDQLDSVHAWNLQWHPEVLSENKRVAVELLTESGRWIIVAVGATFVGSIELSVQTGNKLKAGDELGSFHFGGSSLVIVHDNPAWQEADDLRLLWTQHPDHEILAQMGEPMKTIR